MGVGLDKSTRVSFWNLQMFISGPQILSLHNPQRDFEKLGRKIRYSFIHFQIDI